MKNLFNKIAGKISERKNYDESKCGAMIVSGEMIKGGGEDYYVMTWSGTSGIIGVFDGCGGSGSRRYEQYQNHTGAYVASRGAAYTFLRWFYDFCDSHGSISRNMIGNVSIELENKLYTMLNELKNNTRSCRIKGSMQRDFPTTASVVYYTNEKDSLLSVFMWCGDSRGYIMRPDGLVQITRDDIDDDLDAMSNLKSDGQLTNVISAEGNFCLHTVAIEISEPVMLITATDGSFNYFRTPMEFEYMLIDTLLDSSDMRDWKRRINERLSSIAGDDYTIGISLCGFDSFKAAKDMFYDREEELYNKYIQYLPDDSVPPDSMLADMWNDYKLKYYEQSDKSAPGAIKL